MSDCVGIAVGRFHGFHNGHRWLIQNVIDDGLLPFVMVPRHQALPREPFSFEQRKRMIDLSFRDQEVKPIVVPLESCFVYLGKDEHEVRVFDVTNWRDEIMNCARTRFPGSGFQVYLGSICEEYHVMYRDEDLGVLPLPRCLAKPSSYFATSRTVPTFNCFSATQIRKNLIVSRGGKYALSEMANAHMPAAVVDFINTTCEDVLRTVYQYYH